MTHGKMRKKNNTVSEVSLPLTKGSVLLERTSFSEESRLHQNPISFPCRSQRTVSWTVTLDPWQDSPQCVRPRNFSKTPISGDAVAGQYTGPERNVVGQVDGYFSRNEYVRQSEYIAGTEDPKFYLEKNDNRQHCSLERSNKRFLQNKDPQTQSEWFSSAVPHTQDWSSCLWMCRALH